MADAEDKEINQEKTAIPQRRFLSPRKSEPKVEDPEAATIRAHEASLRMEEMKKLIAAREEAAKQAEEDRKKNEREALLASFSKFSSGKTNNFLEAIKKKMLKEE